MIMILRPWLELLICMGLIGFAGPVLIRNGEIIAKSTGLSQSWVGLVLLATATSLPEMFTGISAVTVADTPNIAVGDALGSCVFNLMMLVLLDEMSRDQPMYRRIDRGHVLTAAFGIILIGALGAFLLFSQNAVGFVFWHISAFTPLIIILYFVAIRAAFYYERKTKSQPPLMEPEEGISLKGALKRYLAAAIVVAAAGFWLPFIGQEIAEIMHWKTTFVGTLLIAATTSVPELAVTISALRMGAVDMAIGNLLGSNLFNILVIAFDDLAYTKGPLLAAVSPSHAITAFAAATMSGIFIVALLYQPETRLRGTVGWVSISLLLVYLFSSYAIFLLGH